MQKCVNVCRVPIEAALGLKNGDALVLRNAGGACKLSQLVCSESVDKLHTAQGHDLWPEHHYWAQVDPFDNSHPTLQICSAGGRVTPDVVRSLAMAQALGAGAMREIFVVHHVDCGECLWLFSALPDAAEACSKSLMLVV